MKEKICLVCQQWRSDYRFKTILTASFSSCITPLFTLWNGYPGLTRSSVWHGSICVYYLLLSLNRIILLTWERYQRNTASVKRVCHVTGLLLILMNLMLIVPIAMMTQNKKPVTADLIIAIAIAAYTTCKVCLAVFHLVHSSHQDHLLIRELRLISFIDAIVAVMSLQTTLITSTGASGNERMIYFSAWTNAAMFLLIMIVTLRSFYLGLHARSQPDE